MRVDKYLWHIRFYKSRSNATDATKLNKIRVNGDLVKPSREVYPGDIITVKKTQIEYTLEVLDIPASRVGAKLVDLYRKDTTPGESLEKLELLRYTKDYYRKKGTGRPTKKDRRDLEDFVDDTEEM